jgi:RNA polymerase sigma-70 factor, ECF subfamily
MQKGGVATIDPPDLSASTDEALVGLARAGDLQARDKLFGRWRDVAYRVSYRLLGSPDDAWDAVQDGFIKALRHLDEFDGRSLFKTWLFRIVTNSARDIGRKRGRRPTIRLADPSMGGPEPSMEDDPASDLHRADLRKKLDAALARLSPQIRESFVLFAEGEMSYKEIAECQGVPIGTIMSRLHFARGKLQKLLRESGAEW